MKAARAKEIVGSYDNDFMLFTIATDGHGLKLDVPVKPEILREFRKIRKANPTRGFGTG